VSAVFDSRYLIVLVLLLGASLSWWLMRSLEVREAPVQEQVRHIPDYYLNEFTVNAMDASGHLRYRLHADHMTHYLDDDTASLARPDMVLFKHNGAAWNATARRGWIGAGQKTVLLDEDVLVWRDPLVKGSGLVLQTDALHITPDRQYAETDRPVTIAQDTGITRAVGMRVFFDQGSMELLADVHGRYVLK
jgi:lipopolysaccharide export system protein LptC